MPAERKWSKLALAFFITGLSLDAADHSQLSGIRPLYPDEIERRLGVLPIPVPAIGGCDNQIRQPSLWRQQPGRKRVHDSRQEIAYLDRKWEQFFKSVAADPLDFGDRMAGRFLGATVWYVPFEDPGRPWTLILRRLTHPLPFLALVFLIFTSFWKPLHRAQWIVIGVYALYILPYIVISYYTERYAFPLLGIKVLLVVWATDRLLSLIVEWTSSLFPRPIEIPW